MIATEEPPTMTTMEIVRETGRNAPSIADRMAEGRAIRQNVPRSSHAAWTPPADRPNPLDLLTAQDEGRLQDLVPIRYGRMLASPFAFLRGSATVMARDLAGTPTSGLIVQACGDAHLSNFGVYGTPERSLVFDLNDFDETLPAPWEWDVKRLVASLVVAARANGFRPGQCADAAHAAARKYREQMSSYAMMSYSRGLVRADHRGGHHGERASLDPARSPARGQARDASRPSSGAGQDDDPSRWQHPHCRRRAIDHAPQRRNSRRTPATDRQGISVIDSG